MELGLGLEKVVFGADGDANDIHEIIASNYPDLHVCGGYTLMCLGENSCDLVVTEGANSGISIPFFERYSPTS